jgi:sRNA-binding regulator protein Hfq
LQQETNFLASLVNRTVRVYLVNGVKLRGILFDTSANSIFLVNRENGETQLIYKSCVASVAGDDARSFQANERAVSSV